MANIAHLTSAHPRQDTRIFIKQCRSLAARGHSVTMIVADGLGDTEHDGVKILDVGKPVDRVARVTRSTGKVFCLAKSINADIYVLHDPELIPAGMKLRSQGKAVVFDSHEDIPKQILSKPYLGRISAFVTAHCFGYYEKYTCHRFNGVVGATPFIRDKFKHINPNTVDINNYPILEEFPNARPWREKKAQVCYVGNITRPRGVSELVQACAVLETSTTLILAGKFETDKLGSEIGEMTGWDHVYAPGHIDRKAVGDVMSMSMAGLVTLHPLENYLQALPVKMFEYMAAGIPVIASNFPLWKTIIESNACGICVDPMAPSAIAEAIDYIATHPEHAQQMGINGRRAVKKRYNWHAEAKKLFDFYENIEIT